MKYLIAIIALLATSVTFANPNNLIVKLKDGTTIQSLGLQRQAVEMKKLIPSMGIQLLQFNNRSNVQEILQQLRQHPSVVYAQLDHKVTLRQEPNDTDFAQQWGMRFDENTFGIRAIDTWTLFGTGGKDANNSDIVVAVVDGGMDIDHPDLIDNVWTNAGEIPDNGIDDDNNGYVDDVNGWNAYTNSGMIDDDFHGSHVAGIIGARGNNNLMVAGVNWDVKLMAVPGASGSTSTVLIAYNYVLDQKKLWLSTDGKEGANIVATNSSFGIDQADCTQPDYQAWNDIYNEMGEHGILSAAATANASWDIDKTGDVPTGCSSPYLVTVTNNNSSGERSWAGYGLTTIDISAPGDDIYSTVSGGSASSLSGTSMATPHVAGAVGYLHSVASQTLNTMFMEDPGAAALELKKIMLDTVTKTTALEAEILSGGILNLYDSAITVSEYGMGEEEPQEPEY